MDRAQDSSKRSVVAQIRQEALRLGFFKIGISPARPLPRAGHFDRWLEQGMHGAMTYMERQSSKRKDPALVLEKARSIIVAAMNYYPGDEPDCSALDGRISRYARGEDYHKIVAARLEKLMRFIEAECPGAQGLYYVDTGPVMEKVWGAETALGWMGKHANLITRGRGSWFFIGVILLSHELEHDLPEKDHCGSCNRCIGACPTGAIVYPYVVDARLCISYLTIELRGSLPRELRPMVGNRIYGCDDCQEVCPWNRFAVTSDEPGLRPRPENRMPLLADLVNITPEQFAGRFHGSAVRRIKRDGFVRNVCVALGNSRGPDAVPHLSRAVLDASPLVRAHAAWALGQIPSDAARSVLLARLTDEQDPAVIEEIRFALRSGEDSPRR
jgi:epoxyqueuosine reductase